MNVKEIMSEEPAFCEPGTGLRDVANMMCEHDCGEIPVVESRESRKPIGVITDRDIACRAVAKGKNAVELTARDCMSSPAVTVRRDTSLEDCCRILEENHIRRVPVVDDLGRICGMVSQADISLRAHPSIAAEVVHEVSRAVHA